GSLTAYQFSGGQVAATIPQLDTTDLGAGTTVSFWMNWNGVSVPAVGMPLSFGTYALQFGTNSFGFNTFNGGIYGIVSAGLAASWHFVTAVFVNQPSSLSDLQLWIDGQEQTLTQQSGTTLTSVNVTNSVTIGTSAFPFSGSLAQVAF